MVITNLQELKNPERSETAIAVEDIGKEKIEALKDSIEELNVMIENREKLSGEVIDDGEKMKMEIGNFLEENKIKNPEDPVEAQERSALRRKKVDICELQLNEKINSWRDIAELKKELRDKEKELSEKEARLNMLNGILEE
jgi:NAD-dependent DNA ligase